MTFFLSSTTNFEFPPIFAVSVHFPPVSRKLLFLPFFSLFFPFFSQIHLLFSYFTPFFFCISFPPTFTMMHLCITQCTYWTPLAPPPSVNVYPFVRVNPSIHPSIH